MNLYCISQKKIDDGEFVYCIPFCHVDRSLRYDPYDLRYVDPKNAQTGELYYTVSATYVSRYCVFEGNYVISTLEWLRERSLFQKLYSKKTFKNYRIWKALSCWKLYLKKKKRISMCDSIDKLLFQNNSNFQTALLKVRILCETLCSDISCNDYSSMLCTSPIKTDGRHTFTVGEFCSIQRKELDSIHTQIKGFRANVVSLIKESCQFFYDETIKDIDNSINTVKETNQWGSISKPTQKINKYFQALKAKYEIVESFPSSENSYQKMKCPYLHIRHVFVKALHNRMHSFIRLIDFLVMDVLRKLVLNALEDMKSHILLLDSKCPIFQINLNLSVKDVACNAHSNRVNVSEKRSMELVLSTFLSPSFDDIFLELKNGIKYLKSMPLFFKTLTDDPLLKPLVEIPHNVNWQDSQDGAEVRSKKWPDLELLFNKDEDYQRIYSQILTLVSTSLESVHKFIRQYDGICQSISDLKIYNISESLLDSWSIDKFGDVLRRYTDHIIALNRIPDNELRGLFLVKIKNFKLSCFPFLTQVVDEIFQYLPRKSNNNLDILLKKIRNGERVLSAPLKTIENLVGHLSSLKTFVCDFPKWESEFQIVDQMFLVAFEYHIPFNAEEKALYQTLKPTFNHFKYLIEACEARKDSNIQKFSKELDNLLVELSTSLQVLSHNIHKPSLLDCDSQQSSVLETIEYLREDLDVLRKRAKNFFSYEECFNSGNLPLRFYNACSVPTISNKGRSRISKIVEDISKLEQDLVLRRLAWKSNDDWSYLYSNWKNTMFVNIDVKAIQKEVSRFIQTVHHLEKGLPSNTLVPFLKDRVMDFKSCIPVISCLRNPFLKPHHWVEITSLVRNVIFDDNSFSLDDLLHLDIFRYKDQIHELSVQASNEFTLEEMLQNVIQQWKVTDLNLVSHIIRDIAIITRVDEILSILDESIVILANIRASRFSSPMLVTVDDFDQKLHLFSLTFKEWIIVQRNWLYLERVFSASDIQRQLPSEAKLFNIVDKSWKDIMRRTVDRPNAMAACTTAGFYESLRSCNNNLEKIHRTLECYLESKRLLFSRFYFLSNNELLDILANSKHVETVQPYLSKCFANIKNVLFEKKEKPPYLISQINSKEGEVFNFSDKMQVRGQVEQWLASFETFLFDAVKLSIKKSLMEFYNTTFIEWLTGQYGEVAAVIVQISFSASVEKISLSIDEKRKQLKEYCDNLKKNIGVLSEYVKKVLLEFERNKAVALIIILVHARDILSVLIKYGFVTDQDFEWTRYLRYCWDEETNSCIIKQSISSFYYGYEYLGCSPRLVITPLTDRCFLTLTGALHFHLGGSLIGPAGTGKSETVKDLAKALGKHCIVFNCSDGLYIKMVSRLLSGVSQSGSWLCLDEFNRIDTEVLSVIAQQLQTIRCAKVAKAVRFYFEMNEIRLNSSSGVFITMNPHYEGRVLLPDNLNSMFRPMSVITPDHVQIVEIVLFSNGFLSAKELSSKLVNLYELARKQLSDQNHYDFGLRSIKALLVMAGEINRKYILDDSGKAVGEKNILLHAIQESNYPRLTLPDRNLFHQILLDIFSEISTISPDIGPLKRYMYAALRELRLQKCPAQLEKVLHLFNTLNIRHGVILIGPTCGGKSTVRKILQKSLSLFENENECEIFDTSCKLHEGKNKVTAVDEIVISPKSCSLDELYGYLDADSAEWNDGLIASSIRNFVQTNTVNCKKDCLRLKDIFNSNEKVSDGLMRMDLVKSLHQWLVLDGPVDTLWVENLNTLLDDSKTLCLANGERIQIIPTMNIIFEVGSLEQASPATISRCGMIFCEPATLQWQSLVKSWLDKLRDQKVKENDRNGLWELFKLTLDPGFEFLERYKAFYAINTSKLVIIQLLCNLLEALMKFIHLNDIKAREDENHVYYSTNNDRGSRMNLAQSSTAISLRPLLIKVYLFCFMWAFGGLFDYINEDSEEINNDVHLPCCHIEGSVDIRNVFDTFLRELFESNFQIDLPYGTNLLYSYYVNIEKNQFLVWDHFVINATMHMKKNIFFKDKIKIMGTSLIPTPSAICYSFLIALLALNSHPVLLMGSRGVGKTTLIVDVLRRLQDPSRYMILHSVLRGGIAKNPLDVSVNDILKEKEQSSLLTYRCNLSAYTGVSEPKITIQSKLVKRNKNVLGSRNGEKIIMFFDDLNMPKPDKFGSIPPLEVLREFLSYGGFYIPKSLQWKTIHDISLIASYTLDAGTRQRNELDRILSKFNTFCFPQPSSKALHHIYVTEFAKFLDWNEFNGEVRDAKSQIISALLGVYYDISLKLKATPSKSHYFFNLHDIGKVLRGLVQADPEEIKTRGNIITLLIHELSRVFLDRLTSEIDGLIFFEVLAKQLHEFLKTKYNAQFLKESFFIFGDFFETGLRKEEKTYKFLSDESKLSQIIEDYHYHGKILDVGIPNEMVFFPQVFRHIASAARILGQSEGHLLLLGIGGTGKKTNARLACFIQQCEFVGLSFSRNYGYIDFKEEVKLLILKAGVKGSSVALFLTDVSMYDSFLEVICNLIATWDICSFIDNETKKNVVSELKEEALSNEISNNFEDIFDYFVLKVKQNFHLIYSATPSGTGFTDKCSTYPAFINNFVVDWYNKWPEKALHIVADKFVLDEGLNEKIGQPVSRIFVSSYCYIEDMCDRYYRELKRYYYVTPKSFLDFLGLFKKIRTKRCVNIYMEKERLFSGLSKLEMTNTLVTKMKSKLSILEPKLVKKTEETKLLLAEIQKDEEKLKKVRAVVNREQEVTDSEAKRIAKIAQDAERDLKDVLPRLEEATSALDSLNKYDIGEIRSYANPPTMVMTVLSAVCVVLNEKPDWSTAKLLLGDPGFLKRLISYDHENMNDKIFMSLKIYCKNPDFNPLAIGKISIACKSMCSWVLALVNYVTVNRLVQPKRIKCEDAKKALFAAKQNLLIKHVSLQKVENQFYALEHRYKDNVEQLRDLELSKDLTVKRLKTAALLIDSLSFEKDRWKKTLDELEEESAYNLSETIIAASSCSFLGPFTPDYRLSFIQHLISNLCSHNMKIKKDFDFVTHLTSSIEVQNWINCDLPADQHSIQNAVMIKESEKWPFVIDPQGQALNWIKKKHNNVKLRIVKAKDPKLISILESAIRFGEVVIVLNPAPSVNSSLNRIILRPVLKREGQKYICIDDKEIICSDNFKLYLITGNPNPELTPELCIKVTIINFTITISGLTNQLLVRIIQNENYELEEKRNSVLQLIVNERMRVTKLENRSLELLHSCTGNILDDEFLIESLDKSRAISENVKRSVAEAVKTEAEISDQREVYRRLAERGAVLFFISQDLSLINAVYQFSLTSFFNLFDKCLTLAYKPLTISNGTNRPLSAFTRLNSALDYASSSSVSQRRVLLLSKIHESDINSYNDTMIQIITETFYRNISYGLFARHQLLFSFHLTTKILIHDGKGSTNILSKDEYDIFLGRETSFRSPRVGNESEENKSSKVEYTGVSIGDLLITHSQLEECAYLSATLKAFNGLMSHINTHVEWWNKFMRSKNPLELVKPVAKGITRHIFQLEYLSMFQRLILIRILRCDKLEEYLPSFVTSISDAELISPYGFDIETIYEEGSNKMPIMFILSPGSDPLTSLLSFVKAKRGSVLHLDIISLGKGQGEKTMDKIRNGYTKKGSWLYLQNCHLALSFMSQLDETIRGILDVDTEVHPQFRLLLSSEPNALIPSSIFQSCMKVSVEPPPGVKNNLLNSIKPTGGVVTESLFEDTPNNSHWKKLVYSLCLFHAVVQERWKFGSLGWNMPYHFFTSDLNTGLLILHTIIESRLDVPWKELNVLTGEIVYGGRIKNHWDQRCLTTIMKYFYSPDIDNQHFSYLDTGVYKPPIDSTSFLDCLNIIENLPDFDQPTIFGMNENVLIQNCYEDGITITDLLDAMEPKKMLSNTPLTATDDYIVQRAMYLLGYLSKSFDTANQTRSDRNKEKELYKRSSILSVSGLNQAEEKENHCAIRIIFKREVDKFSNFRSDLKEDLSNLCLALAGDMLLTSRLTQIYDSIAENKVPKVWLISSRSSCKRFPSWVRNFEKRASYVSFCFKNMQFNEGNTLSLLPCALWLPSFFYPQGVLTAFLQNYGRQNKLSVDSLQFTHRIKNRWADHNMSSLDSFDPFDISSGSENVTETYDGIRVFGLYLDGACWNYERNLLEDLSFGHRLSPLPEIDFLPRPKYSDENRCQDISFYECPLYQTYNRRDEYFSNYVTTIFLPTDIYADKWILNGVAAVCQTDQ